MLYSLEQENGKDGKVLLSSDEAQEVTFKLPFQLPYASDWATPVEANGLIEHEGVFYSIISKDLRADTLYVRCVVNTNAHALFDKMVTHTKEIGGTKDSSSSSKSPLGAIVKLFKKDLSIGTIHTFHPVVAWEIAPNILPLASPNFYTSPSLYRLSPPPQV